MIERMKRMKIEEATHIRIEFRKFAFSSDENDVERRRRRKKTNRTTELFERTSQRTNEQTNERWDSSDGWWKTPIWSCLWCIFKSHHVIVFEQKCDNVNRVSCVYAFVKECVDMHVSVYDSYSSLVRVTSHYHWYCFCSQLFFLISFYFWSEFPFNLLLSSVANNPLGTGKIWIFSVKTFCRAEAVCD